MVEIIITDAPINSLKIVSSSPSLEVGEAGLHIVSRWQTFK